MELDLIGLFLDSDFESLDFDSEIVPLCFNLMVHFLFFNNTFFELSNKCSIVFHGSLVFLQLKVFSINLNVHSFDFLISFVESELSVLKLLFPFLVISSMLFDLFVELIFSLIKKYFSFLELFLEFGDIRLFITDFIE